MPRAGYNPYSNKALKFPRLSEEHSRAVDGLIQTGPKDATGHDPLDSPLYRKVDLWMVAVLYAFKNKLEPARESVTLERFVDGMVLQNNPERIALLEMLALKQKLAEHDSSTVLMEDALKEAIGDGDYVIGVANRYAAAGLEPILEMTHPSKGRPLWQLIDYFLKLVKEEEISAIN